METTIGDLRADFVPPERPKYKSALLTIHTLWSSSAHWSEWTNHFANLGWECWAINLPGRATPGDQRELAALTFEDCVQDLRKAIRGCSFPPVILAHGFGALIALRAAEHERLSALVLVSPLPLGSSKITSDALRLLRLKYFPLLLLARPFRLQEKDFRQALLASVPQNRQTGILQKMVPESAYLIREFFKQRLEVNAHSIQAPVLVIGGSEDKIVFPLTLRETAKSLGADFLEYSKHGHWLIGEDEGQTLVRDIHRWLIQKLGEEILLADFSLKE